MEPNNDTSARYHVVFEHEETPEEHGTRFFAGYQVEADAQEMVDQKNAEVALSNADAEAQGKPFNRVSWVYSVLDVESDE